MPFSTSEQVAEFDQLQRDWQQYEQTALSAAYDQFKSGTEAPAAEGEASQALLRSHMHEIAFLYDFLLGSH